MVDSVEVLLNLLGVKPSGLGPFSALPPLWCFNEIISMLCIILSLSILTVRRKLSDDLQYNSMISNIRYLILD